VESPPLFLGISGVIAARRHRARLVFNVADLWPDLVKELGVLRDGRMLRTAYRLERWIYSKSWRVNGVIQQTVDDLRSRKGLAHDKVAFLPNGADTEMFRPRPRASDLEALWGIEGRPIVLHAGTMGIIHGLDVVIQAMPIVACTHPDAVLLMIGDGAERAKLEALAREIAPDNVRFIEPQPLETIARIMGSTVASVASVADFPEASQARLSKIFSTMAAGVPVLHVNFCEGSRLVDEAHAGVVVPRDPEAIAQAMCALIDAPDERARMGAAGRLHVEQHLTWSAVVSNWLNEVGLAQSGGQAR
jgi:colanic acid biosynthesis glycosyl transferase WcaI